MPQICVLIYTVLCRYVYVWGIGQELVDQWAAGGAALEPLPADADIKFRSFDNGRPVSAIDFLSSKGNNSQKVRHLLTCPPKNIETTASQSDLCALLLLLRCMTVNHM